MTLKEVFQDPERLAAIIVLMTLATFAAAFLIWAFIKDYKQANVDQQELEGGDK